MAKKPYMGRDYNLLKLIAGATKAGVEPDRKKEENKTRSRRTKMKRADNQTQAQQNTMQLQELKALKETLAKQKATIEALQAEVKALKTPKLLTTEQIDKIAATDDLVKAIVDARTGK